MKFFCILLSKFVYNNKNGGGGKRNLNLLKKRRRRGGWRIKWDGKVRGIINRRCWIQNLSLKAKKIIKKGEDQERENEKGYSDNFPITLAL